MQAWQREIVIFLILFLLVFIVGGMTGWLTSLMMLTLFGLLIWQILQINRFEKWLSQGGRDKQIKAKGIWEDIYYHVYSLKKREKRRKKKLGKIIDQFRKSTDALPDAAIVLGKHDEIEWANNTAKSMLGLQTSDKGQRLPNLIRFPVFVSYLKNGDFSKSITIPCPTDQRMVLSVRIINYGAGLRLLIAQDVTQLRRMEQMRKNFVANVSHELRTPLTVLKGYLETLQEMETPEPQLLDYSLQQMSEQTERMQHLVDDLLLLSNLETQPRKSECVNIPALLNKICRESESIPANSGRVAMQIDTDTNLYGDEHELRSAFSNLLSNALKYSPETTKVHIRWHETEQKLIYSVTDQGEGISEEEIPRITERFYRVDVNRKNKIAGTGLGLAIVKHVLIRHDAQLTVNSQLNQGSTFNCYFPLERKC